MGWLWRGGERGAGNLWLGGSGATVEEEAKQQPPQSVGQVDHGGYDLLSVEV